MNRIQFLIKKLEGKGIFIKMLNRGWMLRDRDGNEIDMRQIPDITRETLAEWEALTGNTIEHPYGNMPKANPEKL